jgi:glycosyltransferase involved in cell wall biosynthesis
MHSSQNGLDTNGAHPAGPATAARPAGPEPLTFAIPFYRGLKFLRRAVESVLRQRHTDWHLLVCDDGGQEPGAAELVASYGHPRVRYHRNEANLGMAGSWNRCLELAQTDLVNILHADDELLDGYAEMTCRAAADYPGAAGFFCNARIIGAEGHERFSLPDLVKQILRPSSKGPLVLAGRRAIESLLFGNYIMCPTMCYRKSRLGGRRFDGNWRFALDLEFFTRLLLDGETLVGLPGVGYCYRRHAQNATLTYSDTLLRFEEESRLYESLASVAAERGWKRASRIARGKAIIKLNLLYGLAADVSRLRAQQARRKAGLLWDMLTA